MKKTSKKTTKKVTAEVVKTAEPTVVENEGTAVVVKPPNALAHNVVQKARGAAEELSAADVALPTIILMQSKSTFVEDDTNEIKVGDMVHSMTESVVGSKSDKPLRFVSCYMFKTRQIFHGDGEKPTYINTEAWTRAMAGDDYKSLVKVDGKDVLETRKLVYNHCGYLVDQVRQVGDRMAASPVVIKFKGMSKKHCRKQINSMIQDLALFNEASWQYEFILTAMSEDHEKYGKIQVWQSKLGNKVSAELDQFGEILYHRFKDLQNAGKLQASDAEEKVESNEEKTTINEKEIPAEAKQVAF